MFAGYIASRHGGGEMAGMTMTDYKSMIHHSRLDTRLTEFRAPDGCLAALAMLLGNIAIYVPGLLWLGGLFGWDQPILAWGLTPFVLGDLVKLILAAIAMPLVWRLVSNFGGPHNR